MQLVCSSAKTEAWSVGHATLVLAEEQMSFTCDKNSTSQNDVEKKSCRAITAFIREGHEQPIRQTQLATQQYKKDNLTISTSSFEQIEEFINTPSDF